MSEAPELKRGECGGQSCPESYEAILGTPGSPSTELDYSHLRHSHFGRGRQTENNAGGGRRVIRSTRHLA